MGIFGRITNKQVQLLFDVAQVLDLEARSYSGRGMYGKECFALVVDEPFRDLIASLGVLVSQVSDGDELQDLFESLGQVERDSMGLGTVLYWRHISWPIDLSATMEQDEPISQLNLKAALAASTTGNPEVIDVDFQPSPGLRVPSSFTTVMPNDISSERSVTMSEEQGTTTDDQYQRGLEAAKAELAINEGMAHGYGMTLIRKAGGNWERTGLTEAQRDRLHWLMAGVQRSYHRLQAWQVKHRRQ